MIKVRQIDNSAVLGAQKARLAKIRASRDDAAVKVGGRTHASLA
jgi:hypothetical protein